MSEAKSFSTVGIAIRTEDDSNDIHSLIELMLSKYTSRVLLIVSGFWILRPSYYVLVRPSILPNSRPLRLSRMLMRRISEQVCMDHGLLPALGLLLLQQD